MYVFVASKNYCKEMSSELLAKSFFYRLKCKKIFSNFLNLGVILWSPFYNISNDCNTAKFCV